MLLAAVVAFLILASSVLVYADSRHRGEMFPNTTVLGVDITGMTREEAVAVVTEQAVQPMMMPFTLEFRGRQWTLNPAELGLQADADALVEQAYNAGWEGSLYERAYRRAFGLPKDVEVGLECYMDNEAVMQRLDAVAAEINQEVSNAWLEFDFHPSRDGLWMDVEATLQVLQSSLCSRERKFEPVVTVTPPSLSSEDVKTVLVVDIMGNTLKWYNQDTVVNTYYVATGMPKYPTPLGKFYITRKDENPVWINPNVEWSKDMPPRIEPGEDNPLGVRALVTSAAGGTVLIHGTANLNPGLYSHGCIRMANWAILELFDQVSVGTPVFIWTSRPVPKPPPEEGEPVGPEDPGLGDGGTGTAPTQEGTETAPTNGN
jgi:hypothetical protein